MGHYASEMSSTWEDSANESNRLWKLKTDLKHVPMDYFEAGDAYELSLLYSVVDSARVSPSSLKRFEDIAKYYKKQKGE